MGDMKPQERFQMIKILHKLIKDNNKEKISKILDFHDNSISDPSKELLISDKYQNIKLLFEKYFKNTSRTDSYYGRGKKNNFYLIKVFREVLKPYVEQYNPIPLELDPTPLQNNNLNDAIKSVINEEFPIINLIGSTNWLNSQIIRINDKKDKSEHDESDIKDYQKEIEKNIERIE